MTASIISDMKKFARIGIQQNRPNDTGRNLNSYIVKFNIKSLTVRDRKKRNAVFVIRFLRSHDRCFSCSDHEPCNPYLVYFVKENAGFFASLET